jgi:glycosyltransferase involved in cell wall biosynthesis
MIGKPHILMTTDAVGGVWSYAGALARALCGRGCQVTLVVMGPAPKTEQLEDLRDVGNLDIVLTDLCLEWMDPQGHDISRARETLERIALEVVPDLVHLNSFREAAFAWPAPVLVVAHSCVLSWWRACRGEFPREPQWRSYAHAVVSGLRAADSWIAPSAAFRNTIQAIYRPAAVGEVIYNGIDVPSSTSPKQPFILAAGRFWDEAKNLSALAAIAGELPWPVRLAGPLAAPGKGSISGELGGVEHLGAISRSDLLAHMRAAAIFVAPAVYEPFGLSVAEAAASGCALVVSDVPSMRELWGDAALFVAPRDTAALRRTLTHLCDSGQLRQEMQRKAKMRAELYSLGLMVERYCERYAGMLGKANFHATLRGHEMQEVHP